MPKCLNSTSIYKVSSVYTESKLTQTSSDGSMNQVWAVENKKYNFFSWLLLLTIFFLITNSLKLKFYQQQFFGMVVDQVCWGGSDKRRVCVNKIEILILILSNN